MTLNLNITDDLHNNIKEINKIIHLLIAKNSLYKIENNVIAFKTGEEVKVVGYELPNVKDVYTYTMVIYFRLCARGLREIKTKEELKELNVNLDSFNCVFKVEEVFAINEKHKIFVWCKDDKNLGLGKKNTKKAIKRNLK